VSTTEQRKYKEVAKENDTWDRVYLKNTIW
jgi:hypothetical protein